MSESPPSVSVSSVETSPVVRTLEIEVSPERVAKAFERAYRELAKSVRVRGFRPGKAPRSVLERLYGASLAEEIERQLVGETLPEAVEESGVVPVAEPTVDAQPPRAGEGFRYRAHVEVKPAFELPELEGLPARRPKVWVTDEDVEQELETLRERRATLEDEPEGAEAATGHVVVIDYEGRVDGEPFEGGKAEGATLEIGAGRAIPGFEAQLEGARAGEQRTLRVTFPEDYPATELAGKEAEFSVTVQAVRRRERPALDDAFAKQVDAELEGIDALRQKVREELTSRRERASAEEARRTLLDALLERTPFEVPPGMVERRLAQRIQMAHQQLRGAMPEEELHRRLAEWREAWRDQAEREVRETLVLEKVAEVEELPVSDEEVEARLASMAREQGLDPQRLRKAYEERDLLDGLRARLREEKAVERLLADAHVEETAES